MYATTAVGIVSTRMHLLTGDLPAFSSSIAVALRLEACASDLRVALRLDALWCRTAHAAPPVSSSQQFATGTPITITVRTVMQCNAAEWRMNVVTLYTFSR